MITIENLNENNVTEVFEIEKLCIETPWGINELKKELENYIAPSASTIS